MMADSVFEFNICIEPGCKSTSAFSLYNTMTLQFGYKSCVKHINELVIERLKTESMASNTLFIFYKLVRTSGNERENLAAW